MYTGSCVFFIVTYVGLDVNYELVICQGCQNAARTRHRCDCPGRLYSGREQCCAHTSGLMNNEIALA
jgi:hypothetical protein